MHLPAVLSVIALVSAGPIPADRLPSATVVPVTPLVSAVAPEPPPAASEWWHEGGPRVRATDGRIKLLLRVGLQRSGILRELVARADASHVFVYLGFDPLLHSQLAGRLTFVGNGGKYRYLRVMLNEDLSADQTIAAIAHELQHVSEVIDHPNVRDEASLLELYRRIGRENHVSGRSGWETAEAQAISVSVRRELTSGVAATLARRSDADKR